jgi:haloalkane dehalogenase
LRNGRLRHAFHHDRFFHPDQIETFQKFRTPVVGQRMILDDNAFIERVLPAATVRKLTDEEMSIYRAPFPTPKSRRPTWRFPNDLPIAGEPADVYSTIEDAHRALAQSSYPSYFSWANLGPSYRLLSPRVLQDGSRTAELYTSTQACITCRRTIPM